VDWTDYPHAKRWFDKIAARPAVERGVKTLADKRKETMDAKAKEMLFGATQYAKR
jgi:GST-like protein